MKMSRTRSTCAPRTRCARAFAELPEAVDNTWKIAEQCDLELEFGRLHMPEPELPAGRDVRRLPRAPLLGGPARRMPDADDASDERLRYELEVVKPDRLRQLHPHRARHRAVRPRRGMRIGVRGSAAASLILYCLGVTDIDPVAVQPGLRALPQQRTPRDARRRLRLRRRPPRGSDALRRRTATATTASRRSSPSGRSAPRPRSATSAAPSACRYADVDRVARAGPDRAAHDDRPRDEREQRAARHLRRRTRRSSA